MSPTRILFPAWRDELQNTPYPFGDWATLRSDAAFIPEGTFLDAAIYPIGGGPQLRLSKVTVSRQEIELFVGDAANSELCSGKLSLLSDETDVVLTDSYGRPAGILVSEAERLIIFQTWAPGTYEFTFAQTGFCLHVCLPITNDYFRGFILADGSVLTGDIWLVGDAGIVLSHEEVTVPRDDCDIALDIDPIEQRIRIDVVGDPLFRQRLCADINTTPKFLRTLTFQRGCDSIVTQPDALGEIKVTAGRMNAESTILRIRNQNGTLKIETVGESLNI